MDSNKEIYFYCIPDKKGRTRITVCLLKASRKHIHLGFTAVHTVWCRGISICSLSDALEREARKQDRSASFSQREGREIALDRAWFAFESQLSTAPIARPGVFLGFDELELYRADIDDPITFVTRPKSEYDIVLTRWEEEEVARQLGVRETAKNKRWLAKANREMRELVIDELESDCAHGFNRIDWGEIARLALSGCDPLSNCSEDSGTSELPIDLAHQIEYPINLVCPDIETRIRSKPTILTPPQRGYLAGLGNYIYE